MKKILFVLMACVLCIGLVGGAFAYFTDVEVSQNNQMSAGTLDIQIKDSDEDWRNTAVHHSYDSPPGLCPGEEFTTEVVKIKNVGTCDINYIYARFCNLVESDGIHTDAEDAAPDLNNISKYIILQSVYESNDGGGTWAETIFDAGTASAFLTYWIGEGAPLIDDEEISLKDLVVARNWGSGDHVTSLVFLNYFTPPTLPPGAVAAFKFKFKLSEETTNSYQGDIASFEVDWIADATGEYGPDWLAEAITEPLGS